MKAAASLPDAKFHRADLTNYEELAAAFQAAYVAGGKRLDFVHANAGIIERSNLYMTKSENGMEPLLCGTLVPALDHVCDVPGLKR